MAEYLSPGVYVEEIDSGMKPMEGVSTSTAGFIGMTQRGPVRGVPEFVGSYMDFQNKFGGYLPKAVYGERRYLPMAVEQFFANGGSRCFVVRLLDEANAKAASAVVDSVTFTAVSVGYWGNLVKIFCKKDAMNPALCTLTVACMESEKSDRTAYEESYAEISLDPEANGYLVKALEKSLVVRAEYTPSGSDGSLFEAFTAPEKKVDSKTADTGKTEGKPDDEPVKASVEKPVLSVMLSGGDDCGAEKDAKDTETRETDAKEAEGGAKKPAIKPCDGINAAILKGVDGGPGKRTGLCAFRDIPEISIIAAPGITEKSEVAEIVTHCESMGNRVCILDMPTGVNQVTDLQKIRAEVNSSYAAMYHPWIQVFDPLEKKSAYLPPSGAIAGVYARVDNSRGVHKAPANENIRNCTGLETLFGKPEQDMLNPVGVNLIRNIQGQGIRIWGARTCSSDAAWKYVNVRRLFIFLEESIRRNTGWAVFEPNDRLLWTKVYNSISSFLGTQWRNGALAGASESEAFFVNVGLGSSMTQDDVLNGRMICQIGVAPSRPAEFIIFRISQIMENNS